MDSDLGSLKIYGNSLLIKYYQHACKIFIRIIILKSINNFTICHYDLTTESFEYTAYDDEAIVPRLFPGLQSAGS